MDQNPFLQVLMYFIPAALILMTAYLLIRQFLNNENKMKLLEIKKGFQKDLLPIRLQAYERLVLFLERISPQQLILRVNRPGMSSREMQTELLTTIRAEFEHNLTQQVYVSSPAWEAVRNAKEEIIQIIHQSVNQLGEKNTGNDLARQIFEQLLKNEQSPTHRAIEYLKKEVRQIYLQ